jgi:hypothetical protein
VAHTKDICEKNAPQSADFEEFLLLMMANVVISQNRKKTPGSNRLDVSNSENLKI